MKSLVIGLTLLLASCASCPKGECLRTWDTCFTKDGTYKDPQCTNCNVFHGMTVEDAALKDANFQCGDDNAERQLLRVNDYHPVCDLTVEKYVDSILERRSKYPSDPWTAPGGGAWRNVPDKYIPENFK